MASSSRPRACFSRPFVPALSFLAYWVGTVVADIDAAERRAQYLPAWGRRRHNASTELVCAGFLRTLAIAQVSLISFLQTR